jgi:hypothetical protein
MIEHRPPGFETKWVGKSQRAGNSRGRIMSGIFFDPGELRVLPVLAGPEPGWVLVTHNLGARAHQCRRIMREWLGAEELFVVDFTAIAEQSERAA